MKSKAEINRLGDALREGNLTTENLIALDDYRRSFQPAMAKVISTWQQFLGFPEILVQRPSKATPSIIAKLRRQPTLKLTQIQDIAGLRVWLTDRYSQNVLTERVQSVFPNAKVIDRRKTPTYNYRAVHLIVSALDRPVEIQLRTEMQHAWAHLSERLADSLGHALKYGGGDEHLRGILQELSERIDTLEESALEWSVKHDLLNSFSRTTPFDAGMKLVAVEINEIYRKYLPT
jgi:putative GTP pyrophosphokinase